MFLHNGANGLELRTTRMFPPVCQVPAPGRSLPYPIASCCKGRQCQKSTSCSRLRVHVHRVLQRQQVSPAADGAAQRAAFTPMVLYTKVDAQCDKLSTDNRCQFITLSVRISWQHVRRSTCSPEFGTKFRSEVPLFLEIHTRIAF